MMATAVNVFVMEPTRYCVSGVASAPASTSAMPTADSQTISPSRATAAAMLGSRLSRCSAARSCSSLALSRSGVDTGYLVDPLDGLLDLLVPDAEMRDRAEPARPEAAHADSPCAQPLAQAGLVGNGNEVRLDGRGIDPDPFREPLRARVVVGEALDVVVERVQHRRRGDARLPERTAEEELPLPGSLDRLGRAGEDGAERTAQPFREADRDGVGERAPGGRLEAGADRGIEEAGAVEVDGSAARARRLDRGPELCERPDAAAGAAVRVLEHEPAAGPELVDFLDLHRVRPPRLGHEALHDE